MGIHALLQHPDWRLLPLHADSRTGCIFRSSGSRKLGMVCTAFRRLCFALSRYPLSSYPYATGRLYPYPVVRRDAQWSVGSLVFSRLFGMHGLWYAILDQSYVRVVKNVVEEGSESFGYMLCLIASVGYYCSFRSLPRQK